MAQFDCAVWRPISTNMGGSLAPNLGLVLHHAVMNGSLYNFFNSPSSQVSAHFWVSKSGGIEQYVDTSRVAWHGKSLNSRYVGVETEGCTSPPYAEPMTDQMVNALANLYAEGNKRHGWAFKLADADGQPGFGFHRMAVNTACPCDVRLSMRQEILNRAQGQAPAPPTKWEGQEMIASTSSGKGYWTTTTDGAIYAFGDAKYKGNAMGNVTGQIVGITGCNNDGYWLLASDGGVFAFGSANFYGRPDRV
jgi:N-acetylmuramoyl-L-alanine amidase